MSDRPNPAPFRHLLLRLYLRLRNPRLRKKETTGQAKIITLTRTPIMPFVSYSSGGLSVDFRMGRNFDPCR